MKIVLFASLALLLNYRLMAQCTTNVATGGVATASASQGTNSPTNAIDGNGTTRWESDFADPQQLTVDLGANYAICQVVIRWENASASDFNLLISNDGVTWTNIATITSNPIYTNTFPLNVTGRYLRMEGTARTTGYGYSIYEFEIFGTYLSGFICPSTNLAAGQPAVASSANGGNIAIQAFDNNIGTRWESVSADPQSIYVDLGALYDVCKITLQWEAAYGHDFQLQFSNDAIAWTTVQTIVNNTSTINRYFISGTARYVRMLGTARGTSYGYSLFEFMVFGGLHILPAKLDYFNAKNNQDLVRLWWAVNNEADAAIYELQRSTVASGPFISLSTIKSKGDSAAQAVYNFTDVSALPGENFYRLKQLDIDGRFNYSFVVSATISRKEVQQTFYYEQATDKIQPRSIQPPGNIRVVRIFNAAGRLIKSSYEFQRGISMSDCPPGVYILQVNGSRQQLISKIVKL